VDKLVEAVRNGDRVIFVSQLLEHILRPMTNISAPRVFIANRLDLRTRNTGVSHASDSPRAVLRMVLAARSTAASQGKLLSSSDGKRIRNSSILRATALAHRLPANPSSAQQHAAVLTLRPRSLSGKHSAYRVTGFIGKLAGGPARKIPNRKITC